VEFIHWRWSNQLIKKNATSTNELALHHLSKAHFVKVKIHEAFLNVRWVEYNLSRIGGQSTISQFNLAGGSNWVSSGVVICEFLWTKEVYVNTYSKSHLSVFIVEDTNFSEEFTMIYLIHA